jgi:hypothetical protein
MKTKPAHIRAAFALASLVLGTMADSEFGL